MARITQKEIHGVMTDVIEMDAPADELEDALRAQIAAEQAIESAETAQDAAERAEEAALRAEENIAGVSSFNGRYGAVNPQAGDYTAEDVGALPLSGGTLRGDHIDFDNGFATIFGNRGSIAMYVRNVAGNNDNRRSLMLQSESENSDYRGALQYGCVKDGVNSFYQIFGRHNKPSGTYTGNGSATKRKIDTGGIGDWVGINSSFGTMAMLNGKGGWYKEGSSMIPFGVDVAYCSYGVIYLKTDKVQLNGNGYTYTYDLL